MAGRKQPTRKAGPEGTLARLKGRYGPQVAKTKGKRWSNEAERCFLDHLSATCNVTLSAAETGFSPSAVYARRRDDPRFAQRWQAALEQGCARIEMALVRAAGDAMEGFEPDPEQPIPTMTVRDALVVLGNARASTRDDGSRRGFRGRRRSLEELSDSILTKFAAIDRHDADA